MKKSITIKDIAEMAGVSITTVSRVLNNNQWVADKTKAKVDKVIKEHNFSPNLVARGMISKKTHMLAVVVSDITNPYFVMLVEQIEKVCLHAGYKVMLFDTQSANKGPTGSAQHIDENIFTSVISSQLDGVIILGGEIDYLVVPESYLEALKKLTETIPTVVVGRHIPQLDYPCIVRDQTHSVELVTQHLIDKGYQKIAFIGGSEKVYITKQRIKAFKDQLAKAGLTVDDSLIVETNFYLQHGYQAAERLIQQRQKGGLPEAILAINDQVAIGAIRALKDNHISVPQDIAVASCEYFPGSEYYVPRITTVDHQNAQIGQAVTTNILEIIEPREQASEHPEIVSVLIEGESC
ncbi:LacI family DNA-binding transcriptional regulator [Pseudomonas reactans]|nr:LacI family DNA-binding transcriptional regulator [Pseudomonas reactans]